MYHHRGLLSKALLEDASARILLVLLYESVDGLLIETCEYLDVALRIVVADIEPELIELVWRSALRVEPDVSALCLSELLAVGLGDERTGEGISLHIVAESAADKLRTGGHVAPLVVAAELHLAVVVLVEIQEVVSL